MMELSVPSYVVPGTWAENLRWLLENTSQRRVELLFFMYDNETRSMLKDELQTILDLSRHFSYTVHLPDSIAADSRELVQAFSRVSDGFVVHPPRTLSELTPFCALMDAWRDSFGPDRFFLENTRMEPFALADALPYTHGPMKLCVDVGHLVLEGIDPSAFIAQHASRIRELHVHGVHAGKDHGPLTGRESWLVAMQDFLRTYDGILELEMFAWEQVQPALAL
ncbi:MAG TPA: cobamide remodeling phosphodiesterase CbiR, partial [Spirochaetales bacterium]|nr:cobamide remodeling phosphodiesterase CbiR [Spirochaetales bacterium]